MKRALFLYLFLCLTTFLSSQLNPIPPVNRKAGVVPPINAPQLPSTRIRAATRRTNPLQTAALSFAPSVVYFSGGEFTTSVAVADVNGDGKPDLLLTNYGSGVAVLLVTQVTLGLLSVYLQKPADIASLHVAVGALVLATTFFIAVRAFRLYSLWGRTGDAHLLLNRVGEATTAGIG